MLLVLRLEVVEVLRVVLKRCKIMIIYNSHNLSFIIKETTTTAAVVVVVVVVVVHATPLLFFVFLKIHCISFLVLVFS